MQRTGQRPCADVSALRRTGHRCLDGAGNPGRADCEEICMIDSQRRLEILRNAAETGDILLLGYSGGSIWVRAGKVDLGDETDRGDQALYVDELRAMMVESLVEQRGKDYFRLTGAGFTAAKKALGKINPQETSTTELVEIVKEHLPPKHHWSLAPLFWVTVVIMLLTAVLVWIGWLALKH